MIRRTLLASLLTALAVAAATATPASAQRGNRGGLGSQWDNSQDVDLSSVLRNLRSQYGGRHLDAQKSGNRYVIAWITEDGRRLTIEVDAATGRTISVRGG